MVREKARASIESRLAKPFPLDCEPFGESKAVNAEAVQQIASIILDGALERLRRAFRDARLEVPKVGGDTLPIDRESVAVADQRLSREPAACFIHEEYGLAQAVVGPVRIRILPEKASQLVPALCERSTRTEISENCRRLLAA